MWGALTSPPPAPLSARSLHYPKRNTTVSLETNYFIYFCVSLQTCHLITRLDFRRFHESGLRVGSFPEQRLVIEPTWPQP